MPWNQITIEAHKRTQTHRRCYHYKPLHYVCLTVAGLMMGKKRGEQGKEQWRKCLSSSEFLDRE